MREKRRKLDMTSRDLKREDEAIRSRSRARGRNEQSRWCSSNGAPSGPWAQGDPSICWFGRSCRRGTCRFAHPNGREIDDGRKNGGSRPRPPWRWPSRAAGRPRSHSLDRRHGGSRSCLAWRRRSHSASHSFAKRGHSSRRCSSRTLRRPSRDRHAAARRSSSASSSPSPQPRAAGPPAAASEAVAETAGAPATSQALDFCTFVAKHVSDEDTPEVVHARFASYQRDVARSDLLKLRDSGLLFDMYNPRSLLRFHELRLLTSRHAAHKFVAELRDGRFRGIALQTTSTGSTPLPAGTRCRAHGHMEAPHFAFDPAFGSLTLSDVPPQVRMNDILDEVCGLEGFFAFAALRPGKGSLLRKARVRFETPVLASKALEALMTARPWGEAAVQARLSVPAIKREATLLPFEFTSPDRLARDLQLVTQVVERLDKLVGIPAEVSSALAENCVGSIVEKLDLRVLYLRRVHHFCFYNAAWCADEWELKQRHYSAVLRQLRPAKDTFTADSEAVQAHESRIQKFLATATFGCHALTRANSEEGTKNEHDTIYETMTKATAPEKFQCDLCKKFFKGAEYVHKHLRVCHPELFAEATFRRHSEAACEAFLDDPCRPSAS